MLLIKYLTYCASSNKKKHRLSQRVRYNDEVPKDITAIIRELTASNIKDRLSVRACYRRLLSSDNEINIVKDIGFDLSNVTYLKCATVPIESKVNDKNMNSTITMEDTSSDSSAEKTWREPIVVCEG